MPKDIFAVKKTAISLAEDFIFAICSGLYPVEAKTKATPLVLAYSKRPSRAVGWEKSIITCGFDLSSAGEPTTSKSAYLQGLISIPSTTFASFLREIISAKTLPILPQHPLKTTSVIFTSKIKSKCVLLYKFCLN